MHDHMTVKASYQNTHNPASVVSLCKTYTNAANAHHNLHQDSAPAYTHAPNWCEATSKKSLAPLATSSTPQKTDTRGKSPECHLAQLQQVYHCAREPCQAPPRPWARTPRPGPSRDYQPSEARPAAPPQLPQQ